MGITRYMLVYIEKCFLTEHYRKHPVYTDRHWIVFPNWRLWESPGIWRYTLRSVSQLNTMGVTWAMQMYTDKCSPAEHYRVTWYTIGRGTLKSVPQLNTMGSPGILADVHWKVFHSWIPWGSPGICRCTLTSVPHWTLWGSPGICRCTLTSAFRKTSGCV